MQTSRFAPLPNPVRHPMGYNPRHADLSKAADAILAANGCEPITGKHRRDTTDQPIVFAQDIRRGTRFVRAARRYVAQGKPSATNSAKPGQLTVVAKASNGQIKALLIFTGEALATWEANQ